MRTMMPPTPPDAAPGDSVASGITAETCFEILGNGPRLRLDDLPETTGVYALVCHEGEIRYIGYTLNLGFRKRINAYHTTGSEEVGHKFSYHYSVGRMWRDKMGPFHVPADAEISKRLRTAFIRRHCRAVVAPVSSSEAELRAIETRLRRIAPSSWSLWNDRRLSLAERPEPYNLVDRLIADLRFGADEIAALQRQAARAARLMEMLASPS